MDIVMEVEGNFTPAGAQAFCRKEGAGLSHAQQLSDSSAGPGTGTSLAPTDTRYRLPGNVIRLALATGVPVVLVVKLAAGLAYFRGSAPIRLSWRRAVTLIPAWIFMELAQAALVL